MACNETSNRRSDALTESSDIAMIVRNEIRTFKMGASFSTAYPAYATWDDYEFPVNNLRINPATSKPDYSFTDVVYLFDDGSTETIAGNGHLPHAWYTGSDISPHVHWTARTTGDVLWRLTYKIWDNFTTEPAWATLDTTTVIEAYTASGDAMISEFTDITCSALTTVSPNIKIKLSRVGGATADTYVGDVEFLKFDFHIKKHRTGSATEYA